VARLRRQAQTPQQEVCPQIDWSAWPISYVYALDDRVVNPRWVEREVPGRLGVRPIPLPGGHSPFLARPGELARVLDALAR